LIAVDVYVRAGQDYARAQSSKLTLRCVSEENTTERLHSLYSAVNYDNNYMRAMFRTICKTINLERDSWYIVEMH